MSGDKDPVKSLSDLHIVPFAVSYEWEPCDILKAAELYESAGGKYVKKPGEDLNSIITGILQPKGRVHFGFTAPLTAKDFGMLNAESAHDLTQKTAELIDRRIHSAYKLWPNNFIACDLLDGQDRYAEFYNDAQKTAFIEHLEKIESYPAEKQSKMRDILTEIYANPVKAADKY